MSLLGRQDPARGPYVADPWSKHSNVFKNAYCRVALSKRSTVQELST